MREQIKKIRGEGILESVAVAFMNAGINPVHEQKVQKILKREGLSFISISTGLSRLIRYIQRAETTVVNAYLDPIIRKYLQNIIRSVRSEQFYVMASSGGLMGSGNFNPKDSLLSGPAGGVVGAVSIGEALGYKNIITFDMGGTSTDVARYSGGFDYKFDLELFTNRFMSVAMNMGSMLQRSSVSVNVKERLDFSCALLDAKGELVVNAPHIPVHLGSLGVCVRELVARFPMKEGDTLITNHPAYGGSHLPDITLVTPVFHDGKKLMGYVVNRAHHAEIGGKTPASMPPDAKNLEEEGVVIVPTWLARNYQPDWETITGILINAAYPSRAVSENLADLNAALAANRTGEKALQNLAVEFGPGKVLEYMKLLKKHASDKMRETLKKIPDGAYLAEEFLDDGTPLKVKVNISGGTCGIDFTGTAGVHPGNLNATRAIVNGVVIYVLRLLINEEIPLNEGLLEPVELVIPRGMLDPVFPEDPRNCPAIVGGNVEVSQRLTDTLLKPFGILACSQGTMNNVLFGNEHFSYYETICGGCGAGEGFNGAHAVHHHMTNTRITDPEIIEFRYPVRLNGFSIRSGSGGDGNWSGGDGVIREFLFLEPASLSILSQHRTTLPYGLKGGKPGKPGEQFVIKPNGTKIRLESMAGYSMQTGDRFVIYTPGGGGFGRGRQDAESEEQRAKSEEQRAKSEEQRAKSRESKKSRVNPQTFKLVLTGREPEYGYDSIEIQS